MISQQTLSRPKIQRGKRRARKKKIISHQHQHTNAPAVVMDQNSMGSPRKPKGGRALQAQNIAAMAAARVKRLRSVTTRPKSGSVAFQQRGHKFEAKGVINLVRKK